MSKCSKLLKICCLNMTRQCPFHHSCVAIATNVMICSEPNSMKVHLTSHRWTAASTDPKKIVKPCCAKLPVTHCLLMDKIAFAAAIPLLEMRIWPASNHPKETTPDLELLDRMTKQCCLRLFSHPSSKPSSGQIFSIFLTTFQIQTDIGVTYSRVETVMTLEFLSKFFCNKPGTTATVCLINLTFMPSEWRAFLAALWHRSLRGWSSSQPPQSCSPSMTKCNMFSLSRLRYQK